MSLERPENSALELDDLKDDIDTPINWKYAESALSGFRVTENQVCAIFDALRECDKETVTAEELYDEAENVYRNKKKFADVMSALSAKGIIPKDEDGYQPNEYSDEEFRYIQGRISRHL